MNDAQRSNDEQTALWNGPAGRGWVEAQGVLDRMLGPFEDLLVEAVAAGPGGRVLDVGCGTGSTTLAFARLLGSNGHCTGVDISEPMLALARARAERDGATATFVRADAQTHAFEPASFDMLVSRFGVMFFDDFVAAFTNLRRAARPAAEMVLAAWRGAADNPFMTTAERAAAPLLPSIPARDPDAPGQFAFADERRVRRILEQSGWREIDIRPIDVACSVPARDFDQYLTRVGPLGRALQEAGETARVQVMEVVRRAFAGYVSGDEIRFTGACWLIRARG
jgi:ubiquinone/menaquinone biosynthesis C-methylase UbiE